MTSFSEYVARPQSRRGMRPWSVAAVACGAILLSGGSAWAADDMSGMTNGMICPHASGEGSDALAALGPNESAGPERAPSETPMAALGKSGNPAPASVSPAGPGSQVTKPSSQVSEPATQVQAERPVTTTVQSPVAVALPQASPPARVVSAPRARATHRPRSHEGSRVQLPAGRTTFNGLEPRAAGPYTSASRPAAVASAPAEPSSRTWLALAMALLVLATGLAATLLGRRRRDSGDVALIARPAGPASPSYADERVEAELQAMVSEGTPEAVPAPDEGHRPEFVGSR